MPWILPPAPTDGLEGLVLDGLDLNDMDGWLLESLDMPTPNKRAEWVQGADADGALLVRDPLVDNRTITARIRLLTQASMDQALAAIQVLSMKLEETEQHEDGLELVWTPADSTVDPVTFYVLSATITDIPKTAQGDDAGWLINTPVVTVKLDCKPFGYGDEVLYPSSTTSSLPLATLELEDIPGDVPAEGRLIVTDMASQSRAHVEWGLEQRYYDAASPADLLVQASSMVTSGLAGSATTRSGSYSSGVIRGALVSSPAAICSTGNLAHVGTFRVKLRAYCTSTTVYARLAFKDGDSPYSRNAYAQAVTAGWNDLDLGTITIPPADVGAQRWEGRIEAYSTTSGDTIDIDTLELLPVAEGYGKARAVTDLTTVSTFSAFDNFDQTAGNLTGKSLGIGGTWQGAGDSDDFAATGPAFGPYPNSATRIALSDSIADLAGGRIETATTPTTLTNTVVSARLEVSAVNAGTIALRLGVVARYTNVSNFLVCFVEYTVAPTITFGDLKIWKRQAGTDTLLGSGSMTVASQPLPVIVTMSVSAAGVVTANAVDAASGAVVSFFVPTMTDSALATGGALASGTVGLFDQCQDAAGVTRVYDTFRAYAPPADAVIWSGQSAEFRTDGAIREDSTGTYYGPVQTYRGGRFVVPPAGDTSRTTRVAVKARRNDVDTQPDDQVSDSTKIEVRYRPRYLNVRGA